ncbi:unnamed protein product [Linum tenue]|uniref:Uncharacterized protein n=1 Tax=Linum tenue TaxID=586396 RepID=A0AAV0H7Q2_9ROSI|nr:unnamed protein product [Linum tenue]
MPSFSASSLATRRILILSMLLEWSVDPDIVNRHKQVRRGVGIVEIYDLSNNQVLDAQVAIL